MSAPLLFFYLSIGLGYLLIRPLSTLAHESGHLLYLLATGMPGKITVFIGSLGARKGTLQIRTGRITWVFHPSCLVMRGSLCDFERVLKSWQIVPFAFAGPLVSLLMAALAGMLVFGLGPVETADWLKPLLILATLIPALDFLLSLFYRYETIQLSCGAITANDGQLIGWHFQFGRMTGRYLEACWLFEKDLYAAAFDAFSEIRQSGNQTKELYEYLIYSAFADGKAAEAIGLHREMEGLHAADPFDLCRYAAALELVGDREGAGAQLDLAVRLAPGHYEALNQRAYLAIAAGNIESARADLDKAIHSQRDFAPALCNRGRLHLMEQRYDKAFADLLASLKVDAENPNLHLQWAVYYLMVQDFEAAVGALESARLLGLGVEEVEDMRGRIIGTREVENGGN